MGRTFPSRFRTFALVFLFAALVTAGAVAFLSQPAPAQAAPPAPAPAPQGGTQTNELCLGCHSKPDQTVTLANGDVLSITVNPETFKSSVHGSQDLACVQCHTNITGFPHPELKVKSHTEYTQQYGQTCKNCHNQEFLKNQDSMHSQAMAKGDLNAPSCSSCHNPHTQQQMTHKDGTLLPEARAQVAEICSVCHNAIFQQYKDSVHGQGVMQGNNADVPTCTDCHGVHNIGNPTTAQARLNSPKICANCHTNPTMMQKYGLSTQVLSTYISDFHGTTVTLFQKTNPDQETNKPVCYDCHGVHNIAKVNDPQKGLKIKANMLVACQKCHPEANLNFPDSWLSHYIPSPDHAPLVYYVQLVYKILIPSVIGGMALFVLSDILRARINRNKHTGASSGDEASEA